MAEIGTLYPTLLDIAKRTDPNGRISEIAEMLSKVNPILDDIAWKEGNLPTGHKVTSRTSLPTPSWRRYNQGILPTKSTTEQYVEPIGMLEDLSKVDCAEAKLNGNEAAFRKSEDDAKIQGFNIEVARALFYESVGTNPDRVHGLTPRFNATSGNAAASQIIKADASASGNDQTSIWVVGWGPNTVYGVYPKGSKAGLEIESLGKILTDDGTGKEFTAWVTHFMWYFGFVVHDWRYVVRICNIDTSAWKADLSAGADIVMAVEDAVAAMFDTTSVQPVIYSNRAGFSMYKKQLLKKGTSNLLEYLQRGSAFAPHYQGIPWRVTDAITSTESVVS